MHRISFAIRTSALLVGCVVSLIGSFPASAAQRGGGSNQFSDARSSADVRRETKIRRPSAVIKVRDVAEKKRKNSSDDSDRPKQRTKIESRGDEKPRNKLVSENAPRKSSNSVKPKAPKADTDNPPKKTKTPPPKQRPRPDSGNKPPKGNCKDGVMVRGDCTPPPRPSEGNRPPKDDCKDGVMVRGDCARPPRPGEGQRPPKDNCNGFVTTRPGCDPVVTLPPGPFPLPLPLPPAGQPQDRPLPPRAETSGPAAPVTRAPFLPLAGVALPPSLQPPASVPPNAPPPPTGPRPLSPPTQTSQLEPVFVPDEILFTVAASTPESIENDVAQRFNLQVLERTQLALINQRVVRLRIPDSRLVPAVLASLAAETTIGGRQPNYLYRQQQAAQPAASFGDLQYALTKVGLSANVHAVTGRGATVAVIDTAVDIKHPDLVSNGVSTFDALGGVDDKVSAHGTAIAGIIAGTGTARGIAPGVKLLSVRAFKSSTTGAPPVTTSYVLLKAFDWSVGAGARVLNLSFAGPQDPLLLQAVDATALKDVVMVAAAGNGGPKAKPAYPAAYPGVIAVTATDSADNLYADANQGEYITISAPGVDIFAPSTGRGHEMHSGTSFAAAHVTGIAALLLERNPALTAPAVRKALVDSAVNLGKPGRNPGRNDEFGAGLANATAALRLSASNVPVAPK